LFDLIFFRYYICTDSDYKIVILTDSIFTKMLIRQSIRSLFYNFTAALMLFCLSFTAVIAQDGDGLSTDAAVLAKGKELFDANCKHCHAIDQQIVGPALKDVTKRQKVPWLVGFIKNPQKTIESGDPYAKDLYEKFKAMGYMPPFGLSDDEIKSILSYLQSESSKGGGGEAAATPAKKSKKAKTETASADDSTSDVASGTLKLVIAVLSGLLLIVLVAMAVLANALSKFLKLRDKNLSDDERENLEESLFDIGSLMRSPGFMGLAGLLFAGIAVKAVLAGLFSIGVQQGYAPTQPIRFSHKLHAGYHEIDCKYCHTGASRGKSAGIPSANICMNCHNTIRNTSPEIQKIYAAIEKDEPIQWVRVHNLPDLSYFNHSQHVTVGKIECQTCHGQVQEMEVVEQASLLTMGWCVACRRKTEVQAKDNGYYEKFVQIHTSKTKEPVKVEDIGGLECGKCHY
jgi:mono/diheme cytochrome c family protein